MDSTVLDITSKQNHTNAVLCNWLLSLSIAFWRFVHSVVGNSTSSLSMAVLIWHCKYTPHLVYPFTRCWTCWLFPSFGYYKQCDMHYLHSYEYLCMTFCVDMFLFLWDMYLAVELLGHMLTLGLSLWWIAILFAKAATPFFIPTSCVRVPIVPHPSQHLLSHFLITATQVVWDGISLWFWFSFPWWLMTFIFDHQHHFFSGLFQQPPLWPPCLCPHPHEHPPSSSSPPSSYSETTAVLCSTSGSGSLFPQRQDHSPNHGLQGPAWYPLPNSIHTYISLTSSPHTLSLPNLFQPLWPPCSSSNILGLCSSCFNCPNTPSW